MKYLPKNRTDVFQSKAKLKTYLDLVTFNPDMKRFICTICDKQFITSDGAYNHIDYQHESK